MVEVSIGDIESGKKMHRLLRQLLPGVPLSGIHKMLRTGRIKMNGKRVKANDVAYAGDTLALYMSEEDYERVSKPKKKFGGISTDIDVVYEDKDILVVNKPAGALVHGADGEHKDTLTNRVLAYLYHHGMDIKSFAPAPVHRLDRNTSGLVVFAKNGDSARKLAEDISSHTIRKWYLALVQGQVETTGVIDVPVTRDTSQNRTNTSTREGKQSVTKFYRVIHSDTTSVVLIELISGRTHQIRAHFSHIGHPLYGDVKYGGGKSSVGTSHQWLHAGWLQLDDGRIFHAALPSQFVGQLKKLGYSDEDFTNLSSVSPQTYMQ
ncbi:RluA family pseudouridine synthase [Alicyclobacillus sp. SO9]|uniref:RluA family pseudouridine synthase n=1 Tax=Alicyclobacillus sp. SO9 TaxID=2665646 RepID=UPI0018E86F83|nr:RluA family pseudouridine synthase [Alicyclobacillus sp. SO9]QQE80775.1 RluA family pseudouridine synthase [Alicyclobacillus sp. SO9]